MQWLERHREFFDTARHGKGLTALSATLAAVKANTPDIPPVRNLSLRPCREHREKRTETISGNFWR